MVDLKRLQCLRAMAKKIVQAPAVSAVEEPAPEAERAPKRIRLSEKSRGSSSHEDSLELAPAQPAASAVEIIADDASPKKKRRRKHNVPTTEAETAPESTTASAGSAPVAFRAGAHEPTATVAAESVEDALPELGCEDGLKSHVWLPCRRSLSAPADRTTSISPAYELQSLKEWHVATDCGRKPWPEEILQDTSNINIKLLFKRKET